MDHILLEDPELARAFLLESDRQMSKLELIASENFVSSAVREAQGSVFTHKYAEGYPGKRYYGGCEFVDIAENLAIERAKQLFGCDYVNVQPHSGSQANMASYFALAKPGDTILGMNLSHGGHLTHGSPVNFSGRLFNVVSYGVDKDTCLINYDEVRRLAHEHRPTVIVAGASAILVPSTSPSSAPSPTRWMPSCSWTWPISPASLPPGSIPHPSGTPTSPRPRPTRPCAVLAAA